MPTQPKSLRMRGTREEINKLLPEDRAAHSWYRFILSFPPHLVRQYLEEFEVGPGHRVLDPFCGTGTTVVECKKRGIPSAGIEANPMAHFASQVKVAWAIDPDRLLRHAGRIAQDARTRLEVDGIEDDSFFPLAAAGRNGHDRDRTTLRTLPPRQLKLLLTNCISPLPLHKTLILLEALEAARDETCWGHERLALAKALVFTISNLHFGPEVGVTSPKADAPVIDSWLSGVEAMAEDLRKLRAGHETPAEVYHADARQVASLLEPESVDAVITSPPYPNEKDYTRTTRLESVLLGFASEKADLQAMKKTLVRSNTRGVYKSDDDDQWIAQYPEIERIARDIEARRIELGKTSGFERLYARVTKLYFGGMARHLAELRKVLRRGAKLAYVVGDQASYLRVMIRTGQLLAKIAQALGYEVLRIDLFRLRLATATKQQLREEVVVLRWPG